MSWASAEIDGSSRKPYTGMKIEYNPYQFVAIRIYWIGITTKNASDSAR